MKYYILFQELYYGDSNRNYVCTLPVFDPYARFREEAVFAPYNVPDGAWRKTSKKKPDGAFVYLPPEHPHLTGVLAALRDQEMDTRIYLRNGTAKDRAAPDFKDGKMLSRPPRLDRALASASVFVHHTGRIPGMWNERGV
jgi:hypothetical protein